MNIVIYRLKIIILDWMQDTIWPCLKYSPNPFELFLIISMLEMWVHNDQ